MSDGSPTYLPPRKRLRNSHACDSCRIRKIRCDGNDPCASCLATNHNCGYGSEPGSRAKGTLILDGVLRVEKMLAEMKRDFHHSLQTAAIQSPASQLSHQDHPSGRSHSHSQPSNNVENAILEFHKSSTEEVLKWPCFEQFPLLSNMAHSVFQIEQSRPSFQLRPTVIHLYATAHEIRRVLDAFSHGLNFAYPTLSCAQLRRCADLIVNQQAVDAEGPETCLALLTMALGYASEVTSGLLSSGADFLDQREWREESRRKGDLYFDLALRRLPAAHIELTSTAAHCLLFVAFYFAFLRRPLQACQYVHAASAKCLLLLSYSPEGASATDEYEQVKRVFWSCYILESDYIAELSALPPSGVAQRESQIPLPGPYATHDDSEELEHSSLYFLACISMRRLLNRVHHLLYADDSGAAFDDARFPRVVAELDHQLEEWRAVLPTYLSFDVEGDDDVVGGGGGGGEGNHAGKLTEAGAFLRQRYLTCRSVIYRPFLSHALFVSTANSNSTLNPSTAGSRLENSPLGPYSPVLAHTTAGDGTDASSEISPLVLRGSETCLQSCLLHIRKLKGFSHTVLVDSWICSLSMAGAMLILLAAAQVPSLRGIVLSQGPAAGRYLLPLLEQWCDVVGDRNSPSVNQSMGIVREATRYLEGLAAAAAAAEEEDEDGDVGLDFASPRRDGREGEG